MGKTSRIGTSVTNCQPTQCNISDERTLHLTVTTPCETTTKVRLVLVSNRQYLVQQRQITSTLSRVVSQKNIILAFICFCLFC